MRKAIHVVNVVLVDAAMYLAAYGLSNLFMSFMGWENNLRSLAEASQFLNIGLPLGIVFLTFLTRRLYSLKPHLFWEELLQIIKAVTTAAVIIIILLYTFGGSNLKTSATLTLILFGFFDPLGRYIYRVGMTRAGLLRTNVIIIGMGAQGKRFYSTVTSHRFTTYHVIGFLDDDESHDSDGGLILGRFDEIEKVLNSHRVDEAVIAIPRATRATFLQILNYLELKVKTVKFIPDMYGLMTFSPEITDYDRVLTISASHGLLDRKNQIYKRILDIILGSLGMLFLVPLTFFVWICIKLDDGGPVFFTQRRIGKDGHPIQIFKFRSMVVNAEAVLQKMMAEDPKIKELYERDKKLDDDPRVTKIGAFLRHTSFDEFPQFLNVLKGEMSFIGPRPYLYNEAKDMTDKYNSIIKIKPGVTGLWQATGRNDISFEERVLLDQYYVRNWSAWFDIVIIIKTIKSVVMGRGAKGR